MYLNIHKIFPFEDDLIPFLSNGMDVLVHLPFDLEIVYKTIDDYIHL